MACDAVHPNDPVPQWVGSSQLPAAPVARPVLFLLLGVWDCSAERGPPAQSLGRHVIVPAGLVVVASLLLAVAGVVVPKLYRPRVAPVVPSALFRVSGVLPPRVFLSGLLRSLPLLFSLLPQLAAVLPTKKRACE